MRRFLQLFVAAASLLCVGVVAPSLAGEHGIRVGTSSNEDLEKSGVYVWLHAFMEVMKDSGFVVELYPNSALGGEQDRTEMMRLGLLQVNDSGSSEIKSFSPLFGSIALPFLFDDTAHFDRFIDDTDFLDRVNEEIVPSGIRVLDVALLGGMSGLFNTRSAVERLEDLEGLRLRAMERADLIILNSWDVPGTQVAWEEVPQALETGIAHGYFNAPMVPIIFGHTRQIKHFTNLRMTPAVRVITASEVWLQSLNAEQKQNFEAAVAAGHRANRQWTYAIQVKEGAMLERSGITVSEPSADERERFAARIKARFSRLLPVRYVEAALKLAAELEQEQ